MFECNNNGILYSFSCFQPKPSKGRMRIHLLENVEKCLLFLKKKEVSEIFKCFFKLNLCAVMLFLFFDFNIFILILDKFLFVNPNFRINPFFTFFLLIYCC